ncbi:MAG TPA: S-adenosylmethionine-dependent methyltransferase [Thermopetrobacter sp.]|nr:S-adenosylmethionine-dependent methyltransferase [Thermopetrobacter sp.]
MTGDGREGEEPLPFDPAEAIGGPRIMLIGRVHSPWATRRECPRNLADARKIMRERGLSAALEIDPAFRRGLEAVGFYGHLIVMYWMHEAARNIIIQRPHHMRGPRGVFSLRSPVRPNPIALATVKVLGLDEAAGRIDIDAIDCVDETPLVDVRPWVASIDAPEDWCAEQAAAGGMEPEKNGGR